MGTWLTRIQNQQQPETFPTNAHLQSNKNHFDRTSFLNYFAVPFVKNKLVLT